VAVGPVALIRAFSREQWASRTGGSASLKLPTAFFIRSFSAGT